jgi:predicted flap endonuclease-1-like 5' DNA nuclease
MKPWINEDIFKSWTDAQKRLWESLCSAVPFQPPAGVEAWRETYLKNLTTWESAVKKTLEQEVAWVEQWVHRVAEERGTPEMMTAWVRQMEEVLQRWIQTQNQWWEEYFAVLRRGGLAYPDWTSSSASPPLVEPVATGEPRGVAAESSVAEPEPSAVSVPEAAPEPPVVEPISTASEPPVVEPVAIIPEAALPVEPNPAILPVAESPDDLKLITGIGPALEKKLRACGITTYRQLAALSDADIERVEAIIKSFGRIRRDDWIGQAKAQHFKKYQETL